MSHFLTFVIKNLDITFCSNNGICLALIIKTRVACLNKVKTKSGTWFKK